MYCPLVSIVVPVYNGSNYLAEAIDSALAQTYKNVEILVINDGSDDNCATERIALSYGEQVRYFRKDNGGVSSALNLGIEKMRGEWFSWLSHDDLYYPKKIEEQINYINDMLVNNGDLDLKKQVFVSESEVINSDGEILLKPSIGKIRRKSHQINVLSNQEMAIETLNRLSFHGCAFLLHKDCFNCIGKFDENLRLLNDYDYWFRLLINNYSFNYVPKILVKGRMHKGQKSYEIGFSYTDTEHTEYWTKIIAWVSEGTRNGEYFYRIGKYAVLKGKYNEAKIAFGHCKRISKKYIISIPLLYVGIGLFRVLRDTAKKLYINLRVG